MGLIPEIKSGYDHARRAFHGVFYKDYEKNYADLQNKKETAVKDLKSIREQLKLQDNLLFVSDENLKAMKAQVLELQKEIDLYQQGWANPYGWKIKDATFSTIRTSSEGLKISPSAFITPQDKTLKQVIMKYRLRKTTAYETALTIQKFLHKNIRYVYDHQNSWHHDYIEFFQMASFTWATRQGDCDDYAILFQTLMHICGFGAKSIVECGTVKWVSGDEIGHAYNRVQKEDEQWVIIDPQAGPEHQLNVEYPVNTDAWFIFNFWGSYAHT